MFKSLEAFKYDNLIRFMFSSVLCFVLIDSKSVLLPISIYSNIFN